MAPPMVLTSAAMPPARSAPLSAARLAASSAALKAVLPAFSAFTPSQPHIRPPNRRCITAIVCGTPIVTAIARTRPAERKNSRLLPRRVADRAQQRQQRAIERRGDAVALAGCDDGAGQRLVLERAAGEAVEIHRGAELAGECEQRGERTRRLVVGESRPFGATDSDRFFEHGEAELLDVGSPQYRLALQGKRRNGARDGVEQELAPRQRGEVLTELDA